MQVAIHSIRGKLIAEMLCNLFEAAGIHGRTSMPEDLIPRGITRDSLEHILFLTLTVSIDYIRDAPALWDSSRKSFEDPETAYLFEPKSLHENRFEKVVSDMKKHGLSKKPNQDATIWRTVGVSFYKKWAGDPRNFLKDCGWDSPTILRRLQGDAHTFNGRLVPDYPYLRGQKIAPLWLRILRDNAGISNLRNLDKVPIPVDIHIARATLCLGVVSGEFSGRLEDLFETIREAWFESVRGLGIKHRDMVALDVDEPLWHLSKYGCANRDWRNGFCPAHQHCGARDHCIGGKIRIKDRMVEMDT